MKIYIRGEYFGRYFVGVPRPTRWKLFKTNILNYTTNYEVNCYCALPRPKPKSQGDIQHITNIIILLVSTNYAEMNKQARN